MLLQAAIGAGFLLLIIFCLYLAIGTVVFTSLFIYMYRRISGKTQMIKEKVPFNKETIPFLISLTLSVIILIVGFYYLILLFDKTFPDFLKYS